MAATGQAVLNEQSEIIASFSWSGLPPNMVENRKWK